MTTTILIESIPQGIFRDMEKSHSGSDDTPLMMNAGSFDTMDTIETILDETMALEDMAVLSQKKGLLKRFRSSRSSKSVKSEGEKQSRGRKLLSRLSLGNRRSKPKVVVVETQPKVLASSYTVASEESPVNEREESAEIQESDIPTPSSTETEEEVVEEVSHPEEIVETVAPEVSVAPVVDDATTAQETLHDVVEPQETVFVPEIEMASPVELQDDAPVVEEKEEEINVQVVSLTTDDLVLTMEFDEDEAEPSTEEIIDEVMPEKAPYHQDSADYVGLALVGLLVILLASPMFQS